MSLFAFENRFYINWTNRVNLVGPASSEPVPTESVSVIWPNQQPSLGLPSVAPIGPNKCFLFQAEGNKAARRLFLLGSSAQRAGAAAVASAGNTSTSRRWPAPPPHARGQGGSGSLQPSPHSGASTVTCALTPTSPRPLSLGAARAARVCFSNVASSARRRYWCRIILELRWPTQRFDEMMRWFVRLGWVGVFRSVLGSGASRCCLLFGRRFEIDRNCNPDWTQCQSNRTRLKLSLWPSTLAAERKMFSHGSVRPRLLRKRHGEFIAWPRSVGDICVQYY
jgi:hypothetical protein